jgi:transcriptional regulator with XRE-family HTH domain
MITAAQCRSARALIGWSLAKLATAAVVTEGELDDFELERGPPRIAFAEAVEAAFAGVGVTFSDDGEIHLRPADAVGAGMAGA